MSLSSEATVSLSSEATAVTFALATLSRSEHLLCVGGQQDQGVKGSRFLQPKICHLGIKIILSWKQLRRKFKKALCPPPICLKAERQFVNVFPLLSLPRR